MIISLTRDTQLRLAPGLRLDLTADGMMVVSAMRSRTSRFVLRPLAALVVLAAVGGSAYLAARVGTGWVETAQGDAPATAYAAAAPPPAPAPVVPREPVIVRDPAPPAAGRPTAHPFGLDD